jgi:formylglycine-generating enzyme required for sulfatase activity
LIPEKMAHLANYLHDVLESGEFGTQARFALEGLSLFVDSTLRRSSWSDGLGPKIDIAVLDHKAWKARLLNLRSLEVVESLVSEIIGLRLEWAPHTAIFRDRLWGEDGPVPEILSRLRRLPVSIPLLGPEMVKLEQGTFLMGAGSSDPMSREDERPQHAVHIHRPFALSRFLITNADYAIFCAWSGRKHAKSEGVHFSFPRSNFRIENCREYLSWLSAATSCRYRLPSEAEWEFAARGGTSFPYWWGPEWRPEMANCEKRRAGPTEIRSYPPNRWRLSDMLGSVREWCADDYRGNYEVHRSQDAFRASEAPAEYAPAQVLRGGNWLSKREDIRVSARWYPRDDGGPHKRRSARGNGLRACRNLDL